MLRIASVLLGLALLCPLGSTAQAGPDETSTRSITVTGTGEVAAAPDLAVVHFAVETEAETAASAATRNAETVEAVLTALRQHLGADDRVTTTGYHVSPQYRQPGPPRPADGNQEPQIVGYTARNQARVELHDLTGVGVVIDAALEAGANRVDGLQFELAERGPHLQKALAQASREARAQAEAIAEALGVALGEVVEARTDAAAPGPRTMAMAMEASGATTPVEPGEIHVQATLTVSWAIQ